MLVLTETKLDHNFPDTQFSIDDYRFLRRDRNIHGGGIMFFWRTDLTSHNLQSVSDHITSKVESIMFKLKIGNF